MSLLRIRHYPDPVLKQKAERVTSFDGELRRLAGDMLETMYAAPGVGLAAPQVGVSQRLIVLDCSPKDAPQGPLVAVNPEIIAGEGECCEEEGCLSVPEYYAKVMRQERPRGVFFTSGHSDCFHSAMASLVPLDSPALRLLVAPP